MFLIIDSIDLRDEKPFIWSVELSNPLNYWGEEQLEKMYKEYIGELNIIEFERDGFDGYYIKNKDMKSLLEYTKDFNEHLLELSYYTNDRRLGIFDWFFSYVRRNKIIIFVERG